jgi:outer membrane protein TolC
MNDPALAKVEGFELMPVEPPDVHASRVDLHEALVTALEHRPEISMVAKEIRAASVRENVAKSELIPALDLVLGAYVSGLQGRGDIAGSLGDQFAVGRPTYTAGLVFDSPWCNRTARARFEQRRLEVRRMANQLETTTAEVRADVETAVREVETTHREMISKYHAMEADRAEIDYLTSRWKQLPREGQAAGVVLDDLLEAQERLAVSEHGFATALVAHQLAKVQVRWATGSLLLDHGIRLEELNVDCLPQLQLAQPQSPTTAAAPPERDARRTIALPPVNAARTTRLPAVR